MKRKRLKNESITTLQKYGPPLILLSEIYLERREKLPELATVCTSAQQSLDVIPTQTQRAFLMAQPCLCNSWGGRSISSDTASHSFTAALTFTLARLSQNATLVTRVHIGNNTLILESRWHDEISQPFQLLYPSAPCKKQTNLTAKARNLLAYKIRQ